MTDTVSGLILVAEDDLPLRRMMDRVLTQSGFQTITVENGQKALEEAISRSPDVLLTDALMPGWDAWDWLAKAREAGVKAPAILVTALSRTPPTTDYTSLGIQAILHKPFKLDSLVEAVREALLDGYT